MEMEIITYFPANIGLIRCLVPHGKASQRRYLFYTGINNASNTKTSLQRRAESPASQTYRTLHARVRQEACAPHVTQLGAYAALYIALKYGSSLIKVN